MRGLSSRYITFLSIIGIGLVLAALVSLGYYPIALVNSTVITERDFARHYSLTSTYAQKRSAAVATSSAAERKPPQRELERAVLDELVEERIIHVGLARETGSDLDALVAKKVEQYGGDLKLQSAAETLLGVDFAEFSDRVLTPQAEREILTGRLFLNGTTLEEWIKQEREKASVHIFSGTFYWENGRVERRTDS